MLQCGTKACIKNGEAGKLKKTYLEEAIDFHKTEATFKKRIVSTKLIELFSTYSGLDRARSFVIINFIFLWLCGMLIYIIAHTFYRHPIFAVFSFYTSFSILFLYYLVNYGYDEAAQYFFLFCSYWFFKKRHLSLFFISFFIAICIRETTFLLLPALFYLDFKNKQGKWIPYFLLFIPLFFLYHWLLGHHFFNTGALEYEATRFSLYQTNFKNLGTSFNTLVSFFLVCALPFYLILFYEKSNAFRNAFLLTLVINTFVVLFFAYARESRLFALPLILFWPRIGLYFQEIWKQNLRQNLKQISIFGILIRLFLLSILIFVLYKKYIYFRADNYNLQYAIGLAMMLFVLDVFYKPHRKIFFRKKA